MRNTLVMARLHNTQYACYGQGRTIHNTLYTCYGQDYTIHNTHVNARPAQYTVLEGTQSPQRCPLLLVAMCPDVSLSEDSSATFGGIHQSKGNQLELKSRIFESLFKAV